jgi:hypothetical protein
MLKHAASTPALDLHLVVRAIQRRLDYLKEANVPVEAIALDPVTFGLFRDAAGARWATGRPMLLAHPVVRDVTVRGWAIRVAK